MRTLTLTLVMVALGGASGCSALFSGSRHVGEPSDSGNPRDSGVTSDAGDAGVTGDAGCDAVDHDGDGFSACTGDCDDTAPTVYPNAPPICGNDVLESCNRGETAALRSFFDGADELGIFRYEIPITGIGGTLASQLGFALTPGLSGGNASFVTVSVNNGAAGGAAGWLANPLVTEPTTHLTSDLLLGTSPPAGALAGLTLFPSVDFNGRTVSGMAFFQDGSAPLWTTFDAAPGALGATVTSVGHTIGTVDTTASTGASLGSDVVVHAAVVHDGTDAALAIEREPTGGRATIGLGAYRSVQIRATTDGAFATQSATARSDVMFVDTMLGAAAPVEGATVSGPFAPLGRMPARAVFQTMGGEIVVATMVCGPRCVVTGATIGHLADVPPGSTLADVRGVAIATDDQTTLRGYAAAMVMRGADTDAIELAMIDASLVPVEAAGPSVSISIPGRVLDLGVGGVTQRFFFAGRAGSISAGHTVAVGVLLRPTSGESALLVTGIRACEVR